MGQDKEGELTTDKLDFNEMFMTYYKIEHEQQKVIDATLISLSSGAIALSLKFVQDLNISALDKLCLVLFSWFFFLSCIVFIFFSFFSSQKAFKEERLIIIKRLGGERTKEGPNEYDIRTGILNKLAFSAFFLGLIFLILFVVISITQGVGKMTDERKHTKIEEADQTTSVRPPQPAETATTTPPQPQQPPPDSTQE
jgi:hypothetical protein